MTDKKSLRTDIRAARRERLEKASAAERMAEGEELAQHLLSVPYVRSASCVAVFQPLPTEPDVSYATRRLAAGVRVLVPALLSDNDLTWHDLTTGEDLGRAGIALADVVIAPALAVGPDGQRLGQGGGSYDRALPRRRAGVPVIAVVFPQEAGRVFPTDAHDEPVDLVVTHAGVTAFPHRGAV